jgi:hypothetical protein
VDGFSELHETLSGVVKRQVSYPEPLELGTIGPGYTLLLDRFEDETTEPIPILAGDWYVAEHLTLPFNFLTTTPDGAKGFAQPTSDGWEPRYPPAEGNHYHVGGSHSHSDAQGGSTGSASHTHDVQGWHAHDVITPFGLRPLMIGDRVLIATLYGRYKFVIDRVRSSKVFLNMQPKDSVGF